MNTPSLKTIRTVLSAMLAFLIILVAGVYVYSAYFEKPYISYTPLPFPVTAQKIYPGGVATATATRCNTQRTPVTYKSSRKLVRESSNQPALILESVLITIDPGCSSVSTRVNVVPENSPPGFYRFSGTAVIKGLIFEHEVGWNTDIFEVVAKPPAPAPAPVAAPAPVSGAAAVPLVLPIANATVKIEVKK